MTTARRALPPRFARQQRGMVLLVSLVFLLLLTMLGISSMQNATMQEKMAGSVTLRNKSFQMAEAALRMGESRIKEKDFKMDKCVGTARCVPPAEAPTVNSERTDGTSGVIWRAGGGGYYGIQNLGTTATPIIRPNCSGTVTLYRVTGVATEGTSTTVLESIYANC
ncbi:PilX N-terminal domain-containing pilus assembly protein [Pseudomonas sp. JDS28PS106]